MWLLLSLTFWAAAGTIADCPNQALKQSRAQYPELNTVEAIEEKGGKAWYSHKVGIRLCQLNRAEKVLKTKKWQELCPGTRAINRSACLRQFIEKHPPRAGSTLLKYLDIVTLASTEDRNESMAAEIQLDWHNVFGVQALQNYAAIASNLKIEDFHYYTIEMESEEGRNLVRVEEGPLKMAIQNLHNKAGILHGNYQKVFDEKPPQSRSLEKWVASTLEQSKTIIEEHKLSEFEWRLQ